MQVSMSVHRFVVGAVCLFVVCSLGRPARARSIEPGSTAIAATLGPTIRFNTALGGGAAFFTFGVLGEYAFDAVSSVVADVDFSVSSSTALRVHGGMRFRLAELGALSPFIQGQLGIAGMFNIIGANLFWLGARVGVGADYFVTSQIAATVLLAADLGSSLSVRPAFYGAMELLLGAAYRF